MADGGKLVIKIDGDTKGFYDKTGQINKFANTALKGIAKGATAVGAAMVTIGTLSIKTFADYEQLVGGIDTLFKESSQKLQKYADEAYKTAGISRNAYMENVTSFSASLISSLAGDTEKAADVANMALIDMSDNSNKLGTSMESIAMAYQGFAKQQYMLLDNLKLGYGGTKTEMERLLKDAQKISGVKYDINNLADVYNAIHVIQEELGITGTTAKEASTTITGSINMAKAALNDLLVGIADPSQDIDVLVDNFVTSVKTVIDNVMPRIKAVAEEFVSLFISYLPEGMKVTISAVSAFGAALLMLKLGIVANDLYNVVKRTKEFTTATKLGTAAQKLFNAELALNPYALAATAIAALTAGIITYAATHKSAAKEIRKAYDEEIAAIDETLQKETAQAEQASYLKDRLFELEQQIKSGTLSDEEAQKAKAELTGVANQLNDIIPGIIDNIYDENGALDLQYDEVTDLVNAYVALAKAKAMANAYEAKMQATGEKLIDAENELKLYETGEKKKFKTFGMMGSNIQSNMYTKGYEDAKKLVDNIKKEQENLGVDFGKFLEENSLLLEESEKKNTGIVETGLDTRTGAVKKAAKTQTDIEKEEAEKQAKIKKEQFDEELKMLEFYHKLGVISEKDYYDELAKIRDKYFATDSEEWESHTLDIIEAQAKAITEASEAIKDRQKDMSDSLKDSAVLFKDVSVTGEGINLNYKTLTNTNKQADAIKQFGDNLEKLKAKGTIPQELLSQITEMSLEDGLEYTNVLLGSSQEVLDNYIKGWERIQDESERVSRMFLKDEVEALAETASEDFAVLAQSFFGVGEDGAEKFGDGFREKLKSIMATITSSVMAEVNSIIPVSGSAGSTTYSPTYNILPSKGESTQAQLSAIHGAEALNKARGGY